MRQTVDFTGIISNTPEQYTQDGSLHDSINIRKKDGVHRPVGDHPALFNIGDGKLFVHTIDTVKIYLLVQPTAIWYGINQKPTSANRIMVPGVTNIVTMNNNVIMDTPSGLMYTHWLQSTNVYAVPYSLDIEPLNVKMYSSSYISYQIPANVDNITYVNITDSLVLFFGTKDMGNHTSTISYWTYTLVNGDKYVPTNLKSFNLPVWDPKAFEIFYKNSDKKIIGFHFMKYEGIVTAFYRYDITAKTLYAAANDNLNVFIKQDTFSISSFTFICGGNTLEQNTAVMATINKLTAEANKSGRFEGFVNACYAYKMFDGRYIKHSAPQLIYVGNDKLTFEVLENNLVKLVGFNNSNLLYSIGTDQQSTIDKLKILDSIIVSLDIFITRPISCFNFENVFVDSGGGPFLKKPNPIDTTLNYKYIVEQPVYYLLHTIPIKSLAPVVNATTQITSFENNSFNQLDVVYQSQLKREYGDKINDITTIQSNKTLPVDSFSHHKMNAAIKFIYDGRLIYGSIHTQLFKGFSIANFSNKANVNSGHPVAYFEYEINTSLGLKRVKSDNFCVFDYLTNFDILYNLNLPDVISYPDARATLVRLIFESTCLRTYKMYKHPIHNYSYAIIKTNNFENLLKYNIPESELSTNFSYLSVVDDILNDPNRVQASEVNNPYYFPAKNSYQVGTGNIVALESNSEIISTGQYGQYPLIVFTSSGIWAGNIGDGDVFIRNFTPLNGEVATKVVNIGKGIVYMDINNYLKILNGKDSIHLSEVLHGEIKNLLPGNDKFDLFVNHPKLVELTGLLSVNSFDNFISDPSNVSIGYCKEFDEIIITNPNFNYLWVFSLKSNVWSKIASSYKRILNDYPRFLGITASGDVYDMSQEDTFFGYKPIYLETNIIKFGTSDLKKIKRLLIDMHATIEINKFMGLYVFASIDGTTWAYLDGRQIAVLIQESVILNPHLYSCKYFKIILTGVVTHDSFISSIHFDVDQKYNNKLR